MNPKINRTLSDLQTPYRAKINARHKTIYNEFTELIALPNASQQAVYKHLMKKYKIYSPTTLYFIRKKFTNPNQNA